MPFKRGNPGCPCCECCGAAWDEGDFTAVAGVWDSPGTNSSAWETSDTEAILLADYDVTTSHYVAIRADVYADTYNPRVIFDYVDSDNYRFAEMRHIGYRGLTPPRLMFVVGEVVSGTASDDYVHEVAEEQVPGNVGSAFIAVLVRDGLVTAYGEFPFAGAIGYPYNGRWIFEFSTTITGTQAGFGTGEYGGGRFYDGVNQAAETADNAFPIVASSYGTCHTDELCPECTNGSRPAEIAIEFDGVVNGTKSEASTLNSTQYVLTRDVIAPGRPIGGGSIQKPTDGTCQWAINEGLPDGIEWLIVDYHCEDEFFRPRLTVVTESDDGAMQPDEEFPASTGGGLCCQVDCSETREFDSRPGQSINDLVEYDFSAATVRIIPQ